MPEGQRHRLRYIMSLATNNKIKVETQQIPNAGHFAGLDDPDFVAANILDYLMSKYPLNAFGDIFMGFSETKLWKGDEILIISDLRNYMEL